MAAWPALRPVSRAVVQYRHLLVPLIGSDHAVALACSLAAEHGSSVTALTVIEVPAELPLDAHMLDEEDHARHLLGEAQAIGDLYGVNVSPQVVRARSAGRAIVEKAVWTRAEIVVLPAPRKQRLGRRSFRFGRTVTYVLQHAPCRVMVAAPPPA